MNADVARAKRALLALGWTHDRDATTSHSIYRWPASGETCCVPSSPSDHRWLANLEAQVHRICGSYLFPKSSAGRATFKKGSGFDLEAAVAESARRERKQDALRAELEATRAAMEDAFSRRERTRAEALARKYLALARQLGIEPDAA